MTTRFEPNPLAVYDDPLVWESTLEIGRAIAAQANANTSAPIDIVAHFGGSGRNRVVRIGPTGAAAIVVEFGGARHVARRPVKRALDKFRQS